MAHDMAGLVLHADDGVGIADCGAGQKCGTFRQKHVKFCAGPVNQKLQIRTVRQTVGHASNNGDRTTVAAHRVNRNYDSARAVRRPWFTLMGFN